MSDPFVADNRSGRDNDALLGGLNRNELIAVFVCSFAGLVLIILMTVLVALLIAIRRKSYYNISVYNNALDTLQYQSVHFTCSDVVLHSNITTYSW